MIQALPGLSIVENTYFGRKKEKRCPPSQKPHFHDSQAASDSKRFDIINQRGRIAVHYAEYSSHACNGCEINRASLVTE
jgi:hypothetical protein